MNECKCMTPPLDYTDYESRSVGFHPYGEVRVERCRHCGRHWLEYKYQNEAYTGSGRWYRGIVSPEVAAVATVDSALDIIDALPWHLCGGSYFSSPGSRRDLPTLRP